MFNDDLRTIIREQTQFKGRWAFECLDAVIKAIKKFPNSDTIKSCEKARINYLNITLNANFFNMPHATII